MPQRGAMLILTCPHCGVAADETELAPGGEAHLVRAGADATDDAFEAYLFARQNPKGPHLERWRHAYGCGKWFLAVRDTATQRVWGTYSPKLPRPPDEVMAAVRAAHPGWGETAEGMPSERTGERLDTQGQYGTDGGQG